MVQVLARTGADLAEIDRRQRLVGNGVDVAVLGEFGIDHVKFQQIQGVGGGQAHLVSS